MNTTTSRLERAKKGFLKTVVNKWVLVATAMLTLIYFYLIAFAFPIGNMWLFAILMIGEVFHVFQILMYISTVWKTDYKPFKDERLHTPVDVFITVAGEPKDIVAETVKAAKAMDYPNFKIYILNDGYVAKKENWYEMEELAKEEGIGCITRTVPGGAKAGNINNAVRVTANPYVVIFDADHVPHRDFLQKTMPYFADPKVAFVQSPQFYKNFEMNYITRSSWEQQELFFGPICKGKNRLNSATMCGTNMVIRREALNEVGGMSEISIAEDFLTGMFIHEKGWKSVYVPEVLAEGLAPEDFLSYFKQQFRWARGALDVIFTYNVLFRRGLTWVQKLQYFSSVSFYLSGLIVVLHALIPIFYFFTGAVPITISTMGLAAVFLPYIFLTLYVLQQSTNFKFTFRALLFSMAGFNIHLSAFWAAITRQKSTFAVTPKRQQTGNFVNLVTPHIFYILLVIAGVIYAYMREGISASLITNLAWAALNIGVFIPFIFAALPESFSPVHRETASRKHNQTVHLMVSPQK